MELRNIKTNKCPICGCTEIVKESVEIDSQRQKIRTHCNGGRWEYRKFLCGKEICYEPNYSMESVHGDCINDPTYLDLLKKQKEDKEKILSFCEENEIGAEIVGRLKAYVFG